jgi:phosphate transport system protein
MPSHFEIELDKLKYVVKRIAELAHNQVDESIGFLTSDYEESMDVKKVENKIDKLDVMIDEICQSIFALQQPVASDLRFIISSLKISNETERIGDLAMSNIKYAKQIKNRNDLVKKFNINQLTQLIEDVLTVSNHCLTTKDPEDIAKVFVLRDAISTLALKMIDDVTADMEKSSKNVNSGIKLILILKNFTRISKHCSNIVEQVYFMINAKIIKHHKI